MLKNENTLAKISIDTAENEPSEVWLACLSRTSSLGRINMNKQLCEPVMEPNVTKRMNEPYSWVDAKEMLIER